MRGEQQACLSRHKKLLREATRDVLWVAFAVEVERLATGRQRCGRLCSRPLLLGRLGSCDDFGMHQHFFVCAVREGRCRIGKLLVLERGLDTAVAEPAAEHGQGCEIGLLVPPLESGFGSFGRHSVGPVAQPVRLHGWCDSGTVEAF